MILLIFSFILLLVSFTCDLKGQEIIYTYNEILRIGDTDDYTREYTFVWPYSIASDINGNIYVAEKRFNEVRKYNSEGSFIKNIGQTGRGPGEFTEISAMYIDQKENHLIVVDRMNFRVNRYSLDGNYVSSHDIPGETVISPWMGKADTKSNHYLLYRIPLRSNQPRITEDNLIHVYDPKFDHKLDSFVNSTLFGDLGNYFMDNLIGGPFTGHFEFIDNRSVVTVPYVYNGEIYLFERKNEKWVRTETLSGKKPKNESYRQINSTNPPEYARRMGTDRGRIAGLIFSASLGTYPIRDNFLILYTHEQDEKHKNNEIGATIFDLKSREFLGYTKIEELSNNHTKSTQTGWNIQGITSNNGNVYFIDYRNEQPHIVVAEIVFEILD